MQFSGFQPKAIDFLKKSKNKNTLANLHMKKPKGILFDFGDTVLHQVSFTPEKANEYLFSIIKDKKGIKYEQVLDHVKWVNENIEPERRKACQEIPSTSFSRLIFEYFNLELPVSYEEAEIEFWNRSEVFIPAPGIKGLLEYIKEESIPAGIISNASYRGSIVEMELEKHGLSRYFQFVMSSCDYGLRKPHAFLFKLAASKLRISPENIWFFGDNVVCDIQGSRSAGMTPFYYTGNAGEPEKVECGIIRHWNEVMDLLNK